MKLNERNKIEKTNNKKKNFFHNNKNPGKEHFIFASNNM